MSTLFVDTINEKTSGNGVAIPGHVIQFKTVGDGGVLNMNTSTYTDLPGYSIAFTPKASNSLLWLFWTYHFFNAEDTAGTWRGADSRLLAGSTAIYTGGSYGQSFNFADANDRYMDYISHQHVHTLTSASAVTYKIQVSKVQGDDNNAVFNNASYGGGGRFTIMEIAQ